MRHQSTGGTNQSHQSLQVQAGTAHRGSVTSRSTPVAALVTVCLPLCSDCNIAPSTTAIRTLAPAIRTATPFPQPSQQLLPSSNIATADRNLDGSSSGCSAAAVRCVCPSVVGLCVIRLRSLLPGRPSQPALLQLPALTQWPALAPRPDLTSRSLPAPQPSSASRTSPPLLAAVGRALYSQAHGNQAIGLSALGCRLLCNSSLSKPGMQGDMLGSPPPPEAAADIYVSTPIKRPVH